MTEYPISMKYMQHQLNIGEEFVPMGLVYYACVEESHESHGGNAYVCVCMM